MTVNVWKAPDLPTAPTPSAPPANAPKPIKSAVAFFASEALNRKVYVDELQDFDLHQLNELKLEVLSVIDSLNLQLERAGEGDLES